MGSLNTTIINRSAGSANTATQIMGQNYITSIVPRTTVPIEYDMPAYYIEGATTDYYSQSAVSISTVLNNNKNVTFVYTANTSNLSGNTVVGYNIYKLSLNTFYDYVNNPTDSTKRSIIASALTYPIVVLQDNATDVFSDLDSNDNYILQFPQRIKLVGNYIQDLLEDKSQYFIDTTYQFENNVNLSHGQIQYYDESTLSGVTEIEYYTATTKFLETERLSHTITDPLLSGISVHGHYFTYFSVPNIPNVYVRDGNSLASVRGTLNTFTPVFGFNGVDDGDKYKLEVTYDTTNTTFDKTISFASWNIPKQLGDPEFNRTFSTALSPNSDFLYRIGNTKEILNVFGLKQNVTIFCDFLSGRTASDGLYELSGTTYKNYINPGAWDAISGYTGSTRLSGIQLTLTVVTNSSKVFVGADSRNDGNIFGEVVEPLGGGYGSSTTIITNVYGEFDFGRLAGGNYTLYVNGLVSQPNLFETQTINFNLNSDTSLDLILYIVWGNIFYNFMLNETFL